MFDDELLRCQLSWQQSCKLAVDEKHVSSCVGNCCSARENIEHAARTGKHVAGGKSGKPETTGTRGKHVTDVKGRNIHENKSH